ncbi:MAG: tetratricopeptide repeat protein [Alphaproteobacteria bacterium]|nr:tetratricopeptide repeat protein [Alphaproteobacteria bacterium]
MSKFKPLSAVWFAPLVALAVLAGGCTNTQSKLDGDPMATGSTSPAAAPGTAQGNAAGPAPSYLKTRELAQAWSLHPGDSTIGLQYADALGKLGQPGPQADVLKAVSVAHPGDTQLQARIGKELLAANRAGEAATVLERAVASPGADWKTYSALGSAYDQQGQYEMARSQYNKALGLQPGALSVQNNLAMSFALQGKLPEAEKILRSAMAQPDAPKQPRIRQNLALVVGLEGRFDEARQIASADLPPDQVEANLAYLQQMLAKPNTWAQISNQDASTAPN